MALKMEATKTGSKLRFFHFISVGAFFNFDSTALEIKDYRGGRSGNIKVQ